MTIFTPRDCSLCNGKDEATILFPKFEHEVGYGHAKCGRCGITFDTNINEMAEVSVNVDALDQIDEKEYRELFVETSKIANDDDEVYPNFKWSDNDSVKTGVAGHVTDVLDSRYPEGISSFVDVGCGNGFTSIEISRLYPKAVVHAIDPSPLVKKLNKIPGVSVHQGTLETAELPADSVQVVSIIGNWMLHINPMKTIVEAHRVLEPNGTLILDFKNVRSTPRIIAAWAFRFGLDGLLGRRLMQRNFVNMRYGFTKDYVLRSLKEHNFTPVEIASKPPRLLEFDNKSELQAGLKGLIWRCLDRIDIWRDEQAWIQIVAQKIEQT